MRHHRSSRADLEFTGGFTICKDLSLQYVLCVCVLEPITWGYTEMTTESNSKEPVPVAHFCNPSHSGAEIRRIVV
jgi:hypothetical protein